MSTPDEKVLQLRPIWSILRALQVMFVAHEENNFVPNRFKESVALLWPAFHVKILVKVECLLKAIVEVESGPYESIESIGYF